MIRDKHTFVFRYVLRVAQPLLVLLLLTNTGFSQGWEQVYPEWEANIMNDIVQWNGDTLYSCGNNSTLLRSIDGGNNWETMSIGGESVDLKRFCKDGDTLYITGVNSPYSIWNKHLASDKINFVYEYHPASGTRIDRSFPRTNTAWTAERPPQPQATARYLYVSEEQESSDDWLLHRWSKSEKKWETIAHNFLMKSYHAITDSILVAVVSHPMNAGISYAYRSSDAGNTWEKYAGDSTGSSINIPSIISIVENGRNICFAGIYNEIWISNDSGTSWSIAGQIPWVSSAHIVADMVVLSRSHFFVLGSSADVYETRDGGLSWLNIKAPGPFQSTQDRYASGICSAGISGLVISNFGGHFFVSADFGLTWSDLRRSDFERLQELHFFDPLRGLASAYDTDLREWFYVTEDGGSTWTQTAPVETRVLAVTSAWEELYAYTLDRADSTSVFTLWKSTNQGRDWAYIHEGAVAFGNNTSEVFDFHAHGDVFLFFRKGTLSKRMGIYYSYNRGKSWSFAATPYSKHGFHAGGFACIPDHNGALKYYYHGFLDSIRLYRSEDSCKTWTAIFSPPPSTYFEIRELDVISVDTMFLGAQPYNSFSDYLYLMSTDGGISWTDIHLEKRLWDPVQHIYMLPNVYTLQGQYYVRRTDDYWVRSDTQLVRSFNRSSNPIAFFLDSNHGWLYSGSNVIFRTTNGGVNWTEQPFTVREDAAISSIYPNPVTAGQQVSIDVTVGTQRAVSLPRATPLRVTVYDLLGRAVATLYNGPADPGTRTLTWRPAETLPAGMYVVRMSLGEKVWGKQVAVVR